MIEIIAICVVSALLVVFASLYFIGTKRQKKLKASLKNLYNYDSVKDLSDSIKNMNENIDANQHQESEDEITEITDIDITEELVEQIQIINAQLDLMFELSPAFIVCYDYARNYFYISENGRSQLGYDISDESGESDQKKFESLIHENDLPIYGEVTDFEDIRKHEIAESPYVIKIKNAETETFGEYLMRVKPIYDEDGINKALVAAFINTEYIANK